MRAGDPSFRSRLDANSKESVIVNNCCTNVGYLHLLTVSTGPGSKWGVCVGRLQEKMWYRVPERLGSNAAVHGPARKVLEIGP